MKRRRPRFAEQRIERALAREGQADAGRRSRFRLQVPRLRLGQPSPLLVVNWSAFALAFVALGAVGLVVACGGPHGPVSRPGSNGRHGPDMSF